MSLKSFQGGTPFVETDYLVNINTTVPYFAQKWIGEVDAKSPEVNPLYCQDDDLARLPPVRIFVGGGDFVLPECHDLVARFESAGVRFEMTIEWGQFHLYALGSPWIEPKVRNRTDALILDWIRESLAKGLSG